MNVKKSQELISYLKEKSKPYWEELKNLNTLENISILIIVVTVIQL